MHKVACKTAFLSFFLVIFFALACSRSEPKIAYGFMELVYYQSESKPEERFSFFIIPEDEDGIENLEDLYLYHDREQLRWHISSEDWVSYEYEGKTWIGTRSIALTGSESLPRGQYRAVLVNKGGEKSERDFSFDAPENPRFAFPTLIISGQVYVVDSSYPVNHLVCYDEQGNYIHTVRLAGNSGSIDDLGIPSQARTVALWAEDPQYFTSAFTYVESLR
jgi:hypothetical protein